MSFQPQGPLIGVPPPSAPPPPYAVAAPTRGTRRRGLMLFGLLLLIGGLIGGGALVAKSISNYKEAVKSLARAPVGCTTTLVFDKPATFTVYAETKGKLGDLSGNCAANASSYNHPGDKLPKLSMTLVNSNGDAIDMQAGGTASYDVGGYFGTSVRSLRIDTAGTYRLDVESNSTDFAVAIGKNPKSDTDQLKNIGASVAAAGLLLGLILLLLGLRRRRPEPAMVGAQHPRPPLPGWPPGAYAGAPSGPPAPPVQPGYRPQPPPVRPYEQPPIGVPDRPVATGFAPPSLTAPIPPTFWIPPAPPSAGRATPDDADADATPDSGIGWKAPERPSDD